MDETFALETGVSRSNPRSSSASTVRPAQAAGTVPVTVSQLVPQGGPHGVPGSIAVRGAAMPSATGTGSSGAFQIPAVSGTRSGYTAGLIRSFRTRVSRDSMR